VELAIYTMRGLFADLVLDFEEKKRRQSGNRLATPLYPADNHPNPSPQILSLKVVPKSPSLTQTNQLQVQVIKHSSART